MKEENETQKWKVLMLTQQEGSFHFDANWTMLENPWPNKGSNLDEEIQVNDKDQSSIRNPKSENKTHNSTSSFDLNLNNNKAK